MSRQSTKTPRRLAALLAAGLALGSLSLITPPAQAAVNVVPNSGFRACLNYAYLNQPEDAPITAAQLQSLTGYLRCDWDGDSFEGTQYLTGITDLRLDTLRADNLTPLAGLTNLTALWIANAKRLDLTPLKGLTNLTDLYMGTPIVDITPLANLTKLSSLRVCGNGCGNKIANLEPLSGLHELTELYLESNQIRDLTPLKGLTNLSSLSLGDNQIIDVAPLKGFTNLTYLGLGRNQISDLTPLAGLTKLTWLQLHGNQISDLTPLRNLTNLSSLSLGDNRISDLTPLAGLANLFSLEVSNNRVSGLTPLAKLTNLTSLMLDKNQITDLTPIRPILAAMDQANAGDPATSPGCFWSAAKQRYSVVAGAAGTPVTLPTITSVPWGGAVTWRTSSGKATLSQNQVTVTSGSAKFGWADAATRALSPDGNPDLLPYDDLDWPTYGRFDGTFTVSTCDPFTDVAPTYTFASAICWASATGLTRGSNAAGTTYSPSRPVNRGSMAAFLYRLAGSPKWTPPAKSPFVDVDKSHQFYANITWLADQGITKGVQIGGKLYYQPGNAVNRGSMAAFMRRLVGNPPNTTSVNPFTDLTRANQFYDAILWLADKKITVGSTVGGKLVYQSGNPVTRGSMAAFLRRLSNTTLQCPIYPGAIGC